MEKRKLPFMTAFILIAALLLIPGFTVSAQVNPGEQKKGPGQQGSWQRGFQLTQEEEKAIADILAKDRAGIAKARAEIRISEAKISRLMLEESPDMDAISAEIDRINGFRKDIRLIQLKRQIEIKKLLGEERWNMLLKFLQTRGLCGEGNTINWESALLLKETGMELDAVNMWMMEPQGAGPAPQGSATPMGH